MGYYSYLSEYRAIMVMWKEKFSIGDSEIDRQHKKLMDLYNQFATEYTLPNKSKRVGPFIIELRRSMEQHFRYEEGLMLKADYPGLSRHTGLHREALHLLDRLETLHKSGIMIKKLLLESLGSWAVDHTLYEDPRYMPYLTAYRSKKYATTMGIQ